MNLQMNESTPASTHPTTTLPSAPHTTTKKNTKREKDKILHKLASNGMKPLFKRN